MKRVIIDNQMVKLRSNEICLGKIYDRDKDGRFYGPSKFGKVDRSYIYEQINDQLQSETGSRGFVHYEFGLDKSRYMILVRTKKGCTPEKILRQNGFVPVEL